MIHSSNPSTIPKLFSFSPRLERRIGLLKVGLICSLIATFVIPVMLMGYYYETTIKLVASSGVVTIALAMLLGLVSPIRGMQPGRTVQLVAEIMFVLIAVNLFVLLGALWSDFTYSGLILRYSAMLGMLTFAILAAINLTEPSSTPYIPAKFIWVRYLSGGSITLGLLLLLPVIYHYVGRDWMDILFRSEHPLTRAYFNFIYLLLYIAIGGLGFQAYLKQKYHNPTK